MRGMEERVWAKEASVVSPAQVLVRSLPRTNDDDDESKMAIAAQSAAVAAGPVKSEQELKAILETPAGSSPQTRTRQLTLVPDPTAFFSIKTGSKDDELLKEKETAIVALGTLYKDKGRAHPPRLDGRRLRLTPLSLIAMRIPSPML